jgi:peptidoglycan/xylan/chitin deacetylase (PgdA/CDA1 family)
MLILCYHELAEDEVTPWVLKPETFAEHLEILINRGYLFDSLPRRAQAAAKHGKRVVITFDDGTLGCIRHAHPLLAHHKIRAWFYICTGFVDRKTKPRRSPRYMSWANVRELAQHHEIGAHSLTHPVFDHLPNDQRLLEVVGSKFLLEDRLGRPCADFATPFGYVDRDLAALVRTAGFSTLATTEFGYNRVIRPYRLQRWEVHSPGGREQFIATLQKLETRP